MPTHDPVADAQRDDPSADPADLIEQYEAGPALLRSAVAGLNEQELRLRPVEGRWSTLEVVCHVGDTEQFFADRMKRTLAMSRPLLLGADGWLYPEAVRYHDRDPGEELALVELTRRQVARVLRLVPAEAWDRTAVHSETGLVTLRQLLLHAVRHLAHHVSTIEEKRAALARLLPGARIPTEGGAMTTAIREATSSGELDQVRVLFREYAGSLGFDLCFQGFEEELAALPGAYAPPSGRLLLATVDGEPVGCVALKGLSGEVGEMKRLYVRPGRRGTGLGRALAERLLEEARGIGYRAVRLDTVPAVMAGAVALYRSLGFAEIPAYCVNPVPGAVFLERVL